MEFKRLNIPEAETLADLNGIALDLGSVVVWCDWMIANISRVPNEIFEACAVGAAVRYCRCFSTGNRLGLRREDVEKLGARKLAIHDTVVERRNRDFAHSVSILEDNAVLVSFDRCDSSVRRGVVPFTTRHDTLPIHLVFELRELADALGRYVRSKVEDEQSRIDRVIQQIPLETLLAMESAEIGAPSDDPSPRRPRLKALEKRKSR